MNKIYQLEASKYMSKNTWSKIHSYYEKQDWINRPSLFAKEVIKYFPQSGKVLDLGAGQGQDSRYFAKKGYEVVSTDMSDSALAINQEKVTDEIKDKISVRILDLSENFPYPDESFDILYAHLSLHYFDKETTIKIFNEIERVLKKGGTLAFLVNSTSDPEYGTGLKIEDDFFEVDNTQKRYFSVQTVKNFASDFETILLDGSGETYKDRAKGVHNLIRFVGRKPE